MELEELIRKYRKAFSDYADGIAHKEWPDEFARLAKQREEELKSAEGQIQQPKPADKEFEKFKQKKLNDVSKALYFASYFHEDNDQCRKLMALLDAKEG